MANQSTVLRSPLRYSRNGMIAAAHPLASQTGLDVLVAGGNAADAAVATAAVLNVVLPAACGIGGDAFVLYYDAATRKITGVNGSGMVPYAATVEYYGKLGMRHLPPDGIHSVSVPGAVDAYATVLERFGTMPLAQLLRPAIRYADEGFAMSADQRRAIAGDPLLRKYPSSAQIFCTDGVLSDRVGLLANRDLANSLRKIAEGGRDAFYRGDIARSIVACSEKNGGLFTMREFEQHQSDVYDPIHTDYRGCTVYETALPSQGHIVLEELNIIEGFDLADMGFGSPEAIHHMVEAKKLAFADRLAYSGDPAFVDVPMATMLSKDFAAQRRRQIDPHHAAAKVAPGDIHRAGDTTSFVVVDAQGNAASFIISLSSGFGSGLVADGTGIVLNNRPGFTQGFVFDEGHPDRLEPGKRTVHTLNTYLICRGDDLLLVGNTPGGDNQPQWNFQAIVNFVDFGMNPQQVAEAPRWSSFPGASPPGIGKPYELQVEDRFGEATLKALGSRGHNVTTVGDWGIGGAVQMIVRDPGSGILLGGSDPRAEGVALGY